VNRTLHPLLALLLCNKAPSIPFTTTSIHISKKRLGCSEKKKKRKKKRRKERGKRKIKERGQMSQHREILSSPSSFQKFFKDQERCVFLQRSKSKIRYSPLSSLYLFISTYIYHLHHLPLSPYIHSNHIRRTTHMHILV
jgi:hypothetical protein